MGSAALEELYGSMDCGVIEHMASTKCAVVCDKKDGLKASIEHLLSDVEFQKKLYEQSKKMSVEHHDNLRVNQKQNTMVFPLWKESLTCFLYWSGRRSLELYVVHGLLLNILYLQSRPIFSSVLGLSLSTGNFILTLLLSAMLINMICHNRVLCKILGVRQE